MLAGFWSCAPGREEQRLTPTLITGPSQLTADAHDGGAELTWSTNRRQNVAIAGYNIYVATELILDSPDKRELPQGLAPLNRTPYPGDTDPALNLETYPLTGLENGETHYVVVTTVFPGDVESSPSNLIELVPRPEGDFTLRESFAGESDGFSFRRLAPVATDDLANDIYLARIDGRLYAASPSRIDNVLRGTKFFPLGRRGELDEIRVGELKSRSRDKLELEIHEAFILQDADGCFALVKPKRIDQESAKVTFSFIYQPKPNTMKF
jgi:hypothetical protein